MNYGNREYRFEIGRKIENQKLNIDKYVGRNCRLQVEIAGTRNPRTDMIMDLGALDIGINNILENYDHTMLFNYEFEELTEELWKEIRLTYSEVNRIRLYERDWIYYDKGDNEYMDVTRCYIFDAAHKTHNGDLSKDENVEIYGKCNTPHGHEYMLCVTVRGIVNAQGLVANPEFLDDKVTEVLSKYTGKMLNDVPGMPNENATTENFVRALWTDLDPRLDVPNFKLHKLSLRETARNFFDYYGD